MEGALQAVLAAMVLSLGNSQDRRNMPRTAPGQQKEFYPNPNGVRHPNDYQRNQRFNDYQKTDETNNDYQDNDYQLQGGGNEMHQSETNNRTKPNAESDDGGNSKSETSDPEYCSRPYPKYPIRSSDMPDWCCAKPKPKKLGNLEGVLQKCCISMETKDEKCDSVCLDMDPRVTGKPLDGKPMQTRWTFVLNQETSSQHNNNSMMSASHLKGDCQEFKYSGSGGNENNFGTKAECEESCPYGMPDNEKPLTECQKKSDNGKSYVGKVNMSKNGKKCRKWSKVWSRWAVTYPEEFDGCRNPDNEKGGVWCYVYKPDEKSTGGAVPGKRMAGRAWEHCYVKFCEEPGH